MTGGKSNFDPNSEANPETAHPHGENLQIPGVENTRLSGLRPSVLRTREAFTKLHKSYARLFRRSAPVTTSEAGISAAYPLVCERVRPELKAYLDGQVGWWRQRSIRAHVAQCPACREEMESMRDFSDNLRSADAETLDPALRARILAAVPHTPPATVEARPAWRSHRRPLFLVGAAASAALLGAVLYPVLNSQNAFGGKSASSETSVAQTLNTLKAPKTAAASAPPGAARLDMNGSVDKDGHAGESADQAAQASAPMGGMVRNGLMPAAPAVAAPMKETNEETKSTAGKALSDSTVSAKEFRSAPRSLPGGMSSKPLAKIAQDVTGSAPSPIAPSEPAVPSNITIQVRDVETRSTDVEQKALAVGGKIVLSALSTGVDKTLSATLTLKIPGPRLSAFLMATERMGQVEAHQGGRENTVLPAPDPRGGKPRESFILVKVTLKSARP